MPGLNIQITQIAVHWWDWYLESWLQSCCWSS